MLKPESQKLVQRISKTHSDRPSTSFPIAVTIANLCRSNTVRGAKIQNWMLSGIGEDLHRCKHHLEKCSFALTKPEGFPTLKAYAKSLLSLCTHFNLENSTLIKE